MKAARKDPSVCLTGGKTLGESAGHLSFDELRQVDAALRLVLGL
jgi:hypothetical protein